MKNLLHILRPAALIGIGLLLALVSAALSQPDQMGTNASAAALAARATATPPAQAVSEIGSTDGIMLMSVIIVLIIVAPILWRRNTWNK